MATIYTLNGKVLKNSANDKWLIKKEEPDTYKLDSTTLEGYGYSMGNDYIGGIWRGPDYPNGYNAAGHKLRITVRNPITVGLNIDSNYGQIQGWYLDTTAAGYVSAGPTAINTYFISNSVVNIPVGVYEFDLLDYAYDDYGKYIFLTFSKATTTTAGYTQITTMEALMDNITMEII